MNRNNLSLIALGAASTFFACSENTVFLPDQPAAGTLDLALSVSGLTLNSVRIDIRSETLTPPVFRSRSVDVSDANSLILATEGGLPQDNYTISLDAQLVDDPLTARDESTVGCTGEIHGVSVLPGQITQVDDIVLLCTLDGGQIVELGGIEVNASVEVTVEPACGELIEEMFVGVQQTSVGGQVVLHAAVDSGTSLLWSATGGSVAAPSSADTLYTCSATPGVHQLSLTATLSNSCSRQLSVSVTCVGAAAGTCGDGVVNGTEQCDGGAGCAADCTLEGGGGTDVATACEVCLAAPAQDVAFRDFNEQLCNADPLCVAVKQCVLNDTSRAGASCFGGIPAECYCGIGADLDACETNASFVATGACAAEIVAGAGPGAVSTDILTRFFDPSFPTGAAMAIVDESTRICTQACGF